MLKSVILDCKVHSNRLHYHHQQLDDYTFVNQSANKKNKCDVIILIFSVCSKDKPVLVC